MKAIRIIIGWIITIVLPFFFIMTSVRAMLTPAFLVVEYNMPGFPEDVYGFSQADRLHFGNISVKYLTNSAGPEFLADIQMQDGNPLYNERELSHMVDVKNLVQVTIRIWLVVGAGLAVLGILAAARGWLAEFWKAVFRGGWFTLGLIALLLAAVTINFNALFTVFHQLFFTGGTWLFYYSDSLIRLFPIRFWQDAFILVGGLTIILSLLAITFGRKWSYRASRHIVPANE